MGILCICYFEKVNVCDKFSYKESAFKTEQSGAGYF